MLLVSGCLKTCSQGWLSAVLQVAVKEEMNPIAQDVKKGEGYRLMASLHVFF